MFINPKCGEGLLNFALNVAVFDVLQKKRRTFLLNPGKVHRITIKPAPSGEQSILIFNLLYIMWSIDALFNMCDVG